MTTCCEMHRVLNLFPSPPISEVSMPTDARWVIMPENEVYGYPEPHLDEHEIARWAVVDAFEDDLPLCTTDLPEKAQKIAEALNLAERVSGRLQGELDKILQVSTYDEA